MAVVSATLLAVFYSQIVGATRQYIGTEGTYVLIPRAPETIVLSGNATNTIQWLRWERFERWMYTWAHGPYVKICNVKSSAIALLHMYLAAGASPNTKYEVAMWQLQNNCTSFPVRVSDATCDPASLYIGLNTSLEHAEWSFEASYYLVDDCEGGLGAATFYVTVISLTLLTIFFAISFCVGLRKRCTQTASREYELVNTTDIEIREY